VTIDEKEAFRRIWKLVEGTGRAISEGRLHDAYLNNKLALEKCQKFADSIRINEIDKAPLTPNEVTE
jgi:hypothetical protein